MATSVISSITFFTILITAISLSGNAIKFHADAPSSEPVAPPMEAGGIISATASPPVVKSPKPDTCLKALLNMSNCLTYVEQGSQLKVPESLCCPELAGMLDSRPLCICKLLGDAYSSYGIQIDLQKALNLPSVCRLDAPPPSACTYAGYPILNLPPSGSPISIIPGHVAPDAAVLPPTMTSGAGAGRELTTTATTILIMAYLNF
ncbi:non-specific lipid transfer protein GPI-anchored 11-like [Impatiens glandulifera]|uniref:non-specific lipid transfer protein GPI-anchored 11-like n=1 Tax=Impatiens glandulifera TaxID=253017 RepID=UPI001FB0E232|nr:non-specific lipid transfer protein GPI-anchored 11-like [Impatiens glandulifera]